MSSGVRQGGNLSPLLRLFVNSIISHVSKVNVLLYADDIKIFHRVKSPDDCIILQDELNLFCDWVSQFGISLNLSKCHTIV